jgi:membrane protein involved in colicin uptake
MPLMDTVTALIDRIRDLMQQKDAHAISLQAKVTEQTETIVNLQNQLAKALSQPQAAQEVIAQAQAQAQASQSAFEAYKQESEAKLQEVEAVRIQFTTLLDQLTQQVPAADSAQPDADQKAIAQPSS